jgi:hypothetical protein
MQTSTSNEPERNACTGQEDKQSWVAQALQGLAAGARLGSLMRSGKTSAPR